MRLALPKRPLVDPGYIVVFLLATLAAWPFLTRTSLPVFSDTELHIFRVQQLMSAWQAGVWYPRWQADLFYGFGYPVLSYYAPLTYFLAGLYGLFWGPAIGPVAGIKFVLVLAAYLGALGMYLFVRDRWGGIAGIVSAAAFAFAPYTVFIDPHGRGAVAETFGIALGPLLFWSFSRLRRTASPGDMVVAGGILAALTLSHNLISFVFLGLLVAWLVWDVASGQTFIGAWVHGEEESAARVRWQVLVMLGGAILLGLGLSAFMWLPAILERDAVQYQNIAGGSYFDFHRFFIDIRELFAPAAIMDMGASQPVFYYSVGLAQWLLAALGFLSIFHERTRRLSVIFFALTSVVFIYLMSPGSVRVWEAIRPIQFLQFPYRLLGPTAFTLAVLAGASVSWVDRIKWTHAPLAFGLSAVGLCLAAAMPLLYPAPWQEFGPITAQRIQAVELSGRGIGTTSANDFLPVGVTIPPGPQPSLSASYESGVVDRVNRATLPAETELTTLVNGPQSYTFHITTREAFLLRLYIFYWPGWTAYVDGVPTPIDIAQPDGWMTVWIPEGTHEVIVRLEDTAPRVVGWIISSLSVLVALVLFAVRLRMPITRPTSERLAWNAVGFFCLVIGLGINVRYAADQNGWWRIQSHGDVVLPAMTAQVADFQNHLALLAYDLPQTTFRPGDTVPLTFYWKARATVPLSLRVFVHLIGPDGQLWGQSDKWNPADFPTKLWMPTYYVRDVHNAPLAADAPLGTYTIKVGFWDGTSRMMVLDANGTATTADAVILTAPITVQK